MGVSRSERLKTLAERAPDTLQAARDAASTSGSYDSAATRSLMRDKFTEKFGKPPYTWQLDAAEAFILKLDAIIIAGTGAGKTIPFLLPLLIDPSRWVLILSPLKVLQQDQCKRFKKLGIRALVVNGDTWDASLEKLLYSHTAQAIFTSPEMCVKHPAFRNWLKSEKATTTFYGTNVDEAHCVSQWATDFRKLYGQLEALRSLFPVGTPMHAWSATLEPDAVYTVARSLKIDLSDAFFVNLGNDRPNITPSVAFIKGANAYSAIDPHFPPPSEVSDPRQLPKTIVFTNSIKLTHRLSLHLRKLYNGRFDSAFAHFHAHRSLPAKHTVMRRFRQGRIRVLVATEAAGMGADIPDIELVIQFGFPSTLSMWVQRAGRAGRSPDIQARAVLLAEESAFKRKKKRRSRRSGDDSTSDTDSDSDLESDSDSELRDGLDGDGDEGKEWGKKIDEPLRLYVSAERCRRDVTDEFFNNPPRKQPTGACCDVCSGRAEEPEPDVEDNANDMRPETPDTSASPSSSVHSTPSKHANENGKRPMTRKEGPARRRGGWLANAKSALDSFRHRKVLSEQYRDTSFSASVILPDPILTTLASNARLKTVSDITEQLIQPRWLFVSRHGTEVLALLAGVDREYQEARRTRAREQREAKKQATAARNARKKEAKKQEAAARREQKKQQTAERNAEKKKQKELEKLQHPEKHRRGRPLANISNAGVFPATPNRLFLDPTPHDSALTPSYLNTHTPSTSTLRWHEPLTPINTPFNP